MTMNMTNHVINDRMERMLIIAKHIGWGSPLIEHICPERNSLDVITSTGVLLIKDLANKTLITAYVPSVERVAAICRKCGYPRVPSSLYSVVTKNQKRVAKLGLKVW